MKFKPVAWLTAFYALLGALLAANQVFSILPSAWVGIIGFVAAVLGILLGKATYNRVTPLARPRNAAGEPLKPKWGDR